MCVNGGWDGWTGWNTCKCACGHENQTRTRFCNSPNPTPGGNSMVLDQRPCIVAGTVDLTLCVCKTREQLNSELSVFLLWQK